MNYLLICGAAVLASGLTLFSGFGLGTLLMPVFALFFPVELAVAMTALVHFFNNLFKLALVGRQADRDVVLRFGAPALVASFAGAWLLVRLAGLSPIARYMWLGRELAVEPVKLAVAVLMLGFVAWESSPRLSALALPPRYLSIGGLLSGFFGGLSGHQGALRSVFLIQCGLPKERFIATGVVIACLVDVARMTVYGARFAGADVQAHAPLIAASTASAFAGAWLGNRLMHKVTMRAVRAIVAVLLAVIAVGLGAGWL